MLDRSAVFASYLVFLWERAEMFTDQLKRLVGHRALILIRSGWTTFFINHGNFLHGSLEVSHQPIYHPRNSYFRLLGNLPLRLLNGGLNVNICQQPGRCATCSLFAAFVTCPKICRRGIQVYQVFLHKPLLLRC